MSNALYGRVRESDRQLNALDGVATPPGEPVPKFDALNRPEQTIPLHLRRFAEALVMQKIRLAFGRDSRT